MLRMKKIKMMIIKSKSKTVEKVIKPQNPEQMNLTDMWKN